MKLVEEGSDDRNVVKEDEEPTTYALALYLPYPPPSLLGMRKEESDVRISSNWINWNWKKLCYLWLSFSFQVNHSFSDSNLLMVNKGEPLRWNPNCWHLAKALAPAALKK